MPDHCEQRHPANAPGETRGGTAHTPASILCRVGAQRRRGSWRARVAAELAAHWQGKLGRRACWLLVLQPSREVAPPRCRRRHALRRGCPRQRHAPPGRALQPRHQPVPRRQGGLQPVASRCGCKVLMCKPWQGRGTLSLARAPSAETRSKAPTPLHVCADLCCPWRRARAPAPRPSRCLGQPAAAPTSPRSTLRPRRASDRACAPAAWRYKAGPCTDLLASPLRAGLREENRRGHR